MWTHLPQQKTLWQAHNNAYDRLVIIEDGNRWNAGDNEVTRSPACFQAPAQHTMCDTCDRTLKLNKQHWSSFASNGTVDYASNPQASTTIDCWIRFVAGQLSFTLPSQLWWLWRQYRPPIGYLDALVLANGTDGVETHGLTAAMWFCTSILITTFISQTPKDKDKVQPQEVGENSHKMRALSRAQGTTVKSRQEHIKLLHAIHLVEGLKFCLDQTEIQSTQRSSLNCSCLLRSILLSGEGGATVAFLVGATEGFGQSFPGHIAIRCTLSERCCVTVKSEAQLKDSTHFTSFLINCHPVLVLGSEWPCCWNMKSWKPHDRCYFGVLMGATVSVDNKDGAGLRGRARNPISARWPSSAGSPQRPRRVSGKSAWGRTPLQEAARKGHVDEVKTLLSKGAAVDAKNKDGSGPQKQDQRSGKDLKSGKQAPEIESRTWGASKSFSGLKWTYFTTLFLTAFSMLEKQKIHLVLSKTMSVVRKMYWNLFSVFVVLFCFVR